MTLPVILQTTVKPTKNPRIRPTNRPALLGTEVHCVNLNMNFHAVNRTVRQAHPHKRRQARRRRMQDVRRAPVNTFYRCPDTTCPTQGYLHLTKGVLRLSLTHFTCKCGKALTLAV